MDIGFQLAKVLLLTLLLGLVWGTAHASSTPSYRVYFTNTNEGGVLPGKETDQFDCGDKIHGALEVSGLAKEKHLLVIYWFNPRGKRQEYTRLDFTIHSEKQTVWAWLKLHRPSGAIIERLFLQNSASGMEDLIGKWKAKFYVDGKRVGEGSFSVFC